MPTVTITGVSPDPDVFANVATAANYIAAMPSGGTYTAWLALSTDDRGRTLVGATRYMNRLGLVDAGVPIVPGTTIQAVIDACAELAVLVADDQEVLSAIDASSNIQSVNAGGAGVTFFNPSTVAGGTASKLPNVVQGLLEPYLPSATITSSATLGQSGDCSTAFDEADTYRVTGPY